MYIVPLKTTQLVINSKKHPIILKFSKVSNIFFNILIYLLYITIFSFKAYNYHLFEHVRSNFFLSMAGKTHENHIPQVTRRLRLFLRT